MGQGQPKPPAQPPKDHAKDATDKNAADKLTTDKLLQDAPPKDENKDLKDTVYPDLPDPLADPQGLGRLKRKLLKEVLLDGPNDGGTTGSTIDPKILKDVILDGPGKGSKDLSDETGAVRPKSLKDVIVDGPGRPLSTAVIAPGGMARSFIRPTERPTVGAPLYGGARRDAGTLKPIVVIAAPEDLPAVTLVARLGRERALLMTPGDLAQDGWRFRPGAPQRTRVVANGVALEADEIGGALVRLSAIAPHHLLQVHQVDRAYVAAEMTAFLHAWLLSLTCPVLNRPSSFALNGPGLRPEAWVRIAARLGLHFVPVQRTVSRSATKSMPSPPRLTTLVVVGARCISAADEPLTKAARAIAGAANAELLAVHFDGARGDSRLVGASVLVDLANDTIAGAVEEHFFGSQSAPARTVLA